MRYIIQISLALVMFMVTIFTIVYCYTPVHILSIRYDDLAICQ